LSLGCLHSTGALLTKTHEVKKITKAKYMRIARLYTLMSALNTYTTTKHAMPYVAGDKKVPMIHKIVWDFGINAADIPGTAGDYVEWIHQLTSKEEAAFKRNDHETVLATHATLLSFLVAGGGGGFYDDHHGKNTVDFPIPIAYPFDEIWLAAWSVGASNVAWAGCTIYYTVETMALEDILQAREELS